MEFDGAFAKNSNFYSIHFFHDCSLNVGDRQRKRSIERKTRVAEHPINPGKVIAMAFHFITQRALMYDVPSQSRSQSLVPPDQRSENESSGSIHFEITMANNRILGIGLTAQSQSASVACYGACLKWMLPEHKRQKSLGFRFYLVSFAAVIRVVTHRSSPLTAAHSSSAFLSSN